MSERKSQRKLTPPEVEAADKVFGALASSRTANVDAFATIRAALRQTEEGQDANLPPITSREIVIAEEAVKRLKGSEILPKDFSTRDIEEDLANWKEEVSASEEEEVSLRRQKNRGLKTAGKFLAGTAMLGGICYGLSEATSAISAADARAAHAREVALEKHILGSDPTDPSFKGWTVKVAKNQPYEIVPLSNGHQYKTYENDFKSDFIPFPDQPKEKTGIWATKHKLFDGSEALKLKIYTENISLDYPNSEEWLVKDKNAVLEFENNKGKTIFMQIKPFKSDPDKLLVYQVKPKK